MGQETWYVVRCNIKSEDKAERNLREAGYRTYAPWQRFERFNSRKKVFIKREMRLAPRYIFLDTGGMHRDSTPWGVIRACEGVEKVLGYQGLPIPLHGDEVKALHAIMAAEANYEFDETRAGKLHRREIGKNKKETTRLRFPVGAKITIKDGPFASFSGEVTNVNGRGHVQALVGILGRLVSTEVETKHLALDSEAA
jgi:transcription antitermination factor NusG